MKNINHLFKGLALLLTLCFLVAQPLLQNNYFLQVSTFEMTQNDIEDDTEEEEQQEDENRDEKNETIAVYPYSLILEYATTATGRKPKEIILKIAADIHIPPPDCA